MDVWIDWLHVCLGGRWVNGWLAGWVSNGLFFLFPAHASGLKSQVSLAVSEKVSQQCPRLQPLRSLLSFVPYAWLSRVQGWETSSTAFLNSLCIVLPPCMVQAWPFVLLLSPPRMFFPPLFFKLYFYFSITILLSFPWPSLYTSQHVSSVSLSLCMKGHDCNNVRTFCSFSCKIGVQETEVFSYLVFSSWISFFILEIFFLKASKSLELLFTVAFKESSYLLVNKQKLHIYFISYN